MTGIIIITYNVSHLLPYQAKCIKKFCKDSYHIHVYDTSNVESISHTLKALCVQHGISYHRHEQTAPGMHGGSRSHADAANFAWKQLADKYEYLMFLDHDIFPVKPFSIADHMGEHVIISGLPQVKTNPQNRDKITYLWPGLLMIRGKHTVMVDVVDFSNDEQMGLDTGGYLYKTLNTLSPEHIVLLNETHVKNKRFNIGFYTFYCMLWNNKFMHFVNASNWANAEGNSLRMHTLIDILKEKTNII